MTRAVFTLGARERVDASATTALLRLSGTWTAADEQTLGAPVLVVTAQGRRHEVAGLPDPAGPPVAGPDGRSWRGGFALSRTLADAITGLVLTAPGAEPAILLTPERPREGAPVAEPRARHADGASAPRHDLEGSDLAAALANARYALRVAERERQELQAEHEHVVGELSDARRRSMETALPDPAGDHGGSDPELAAARLAEAERDRRQLRETVARLEDDAARRDDTEVTLLRRRTGTLEHELAAARDQLDRQARRVFDLEVEVQAAVGRAREESQARDEAEARAATAAGGHPPAADRSTQPPAGLGDETVRALQVRDAAVSRARALEAGLRAARAEVDDLRAELLHSQGLVAEASERLREETELRMHTEARVERSV